MKILRSFLYAFQGLKHCICTQRNFRFHIVAAVSILIASSFYNFSKFELLTLAATIVMVLVCEMINTALEAVVDMHGDEYSLNAKVAKDVAAGAVLMSAIFSVAVAFVLFWDMEVIALIVAFFIHNPIMLALIVVYAVLCILFVTGALFKNKI